MLLLALSLAGTLVAQEPPRMDLARRAAELAPLGSKPLQTRITPDHHGTRLELKFADGSGVRLIGGSFQAASTEVIGVDAVLADFGGTPYRVFSQEPEWLEEFRLRGEARTGAPLHDLNLFYGVHLAEEGRVGEVCDALNALSIVELAYPLPSVSDPVVATAPAAAPGGTPAYDYLQGYRGPAPTGIDADYGNTFSGGAGLGTKIADVETGWTDDHEDLAHAALGNYVGLAPLHYPWDHGTAVLGELIGEHNDSGVRGIVYQSEVLMSTHQGSSANIPTAVMNAIAAVDPGDAVVMEVQCSGGPPGPYPCEYVGSTYAAVEAATANGIHVFAAAGNGTNDLDDASYGGLFDRNVRDSGAVMVGASNGASLDIAWFSNHGSRVDVHGWGFDVTSTGYGDLQGGAATVEYTAAFSGTSSATPIVTGAGVILNSIELAVHGSPLDPLVLRDLLTNTGTPQGAGGNIGPRPNVRAAIEALGLPRIEVAGNLVPGGDYTVTSHGPPNAACVLIFGPSLRSDRLPISPYGQLFLANPWGRVVSAAIPASGEFVFDATVPNDSGLSGTTYGYYQGWQRYPGTNGGAFVNYAPVDVQ